MQINVQQIRDLETIERELHNSPKGILALYIDEKVIQIAKTFLYQDKNIYVFLDDDSELYQSIHFNSHASFALIKNNRNKKGTKSHNSSLYESFSITISGNIRKVEDQKPIDEIKAKYLKKYSAQDDANHDLTSVKGKPVIIDTEEIQAIEEKGG